MTGQEASDMLRRQAAEVQRGVDQILDGTRAEAVVTIRSEWPVLSGESRDGWANRDGAIVNDVPYASDVGDGLADRLIPDVLLRLEPRTIAQLEALL